MAELPNLAGVVTKDLVEKIGTGKYSAAYVNWSRTMQLFRENAPGWFIEVVNNPEGGMLHKSPVGAKILLRLRHLDGTVTPAVPQAVMDNRNNAIPFDKIDSRDETDTHRRGSCLLLAFQTGLAYELWAKMPLENPYRISGGEEPLEAPKAGTPAPAPVTQKKAPAAGGAKASEKPEHPVVRSEVLKKAEEGAATEAMFREAALEKGFTTFAIDGLLGVIKGDYATGISTVAKKTADEVETLNAKFAQW